MTTFSRSRLILVAFLGLLVVDCKHTPTPAEPEPSPIHHCLSLLESEGSLTVESPYVATQPVIKFDQQPVSVTEFRRFGALYAQIPGRRDSERAVREFERYWYGQQLASEAGVVVTRAEIDAQMRAIEARFPDAETFERFLTDSGATRRKLRVAVCRDLRLVEWLTREHEVAVSEDEVSDAVDHGAFSHLSERGVADEDARDLARRALEASRFISTSREVFDRTRIGGQVARYGRVKLDRAYFDDEWGVSGTTRVELSLRRGRWSARVRMAPSGLREMNGLVHEDLVAVPGHPIDLRLTAGSPPYTTYLVDDRVVLAADPRKRLDNEVELVADDGELGLRSENQSAAIWVDSLGTLSLTYIDVMTRQEVAEPAMKPRGKPLGREIRYACHHNEAVCSSAQFNVDVLDEEEAKTWAVYSYPEPSPGKVYARHCATCHGAGGEGRGETHPPVVGTRWVTGELGVEALVDSVVLGSRAESLSGTTKIAGRAWGSDMMPAFAEHLEPYEVTAAINYVTTELDGGGPRVSEQQVIDAYCRNGYGVIYQARVEAGEAAERIERARTSGDCTDGIRERFEAIDQPTNDENLRERIELMYEQSCAMCHGAEGTGDGPLAQSLSAEPTDFTDASDWEHGRHAAGAFMTLTDGSDHHASIDWVTRLPFDERKALAQKAVSFLPEDAREPEKARQAYLPYCRELTEKRRLYWDRCPER